MSDAAKVKLGCVTSVSRTAKFQQLLYRLETILTDDFIRADKKKKNLCISCGFFSMQIGKADGFQLASINQ